MSAFPRDFDRKQPPPPADERRSPPARAPEPAKKTSWFYVFEQWISVPSSDDDEFVLA